MNMKPGCSWKHAAWTTTVQGGATKRYGACARPILYIILHRLHDMLQLDVVFNRIEYMYLVCAVQQDSVGTSLKNKAEPRRRGRALRAPTTELRFIRYLVLT
mgnify:CR=1 FL=1